MGDCGLTGRKIIVDTYGGMGRTRRRRVLGQGPEQGGPLGCYAARWVAKNLVASRACATAARCEVAYAIGVAEPVSVMVDSFGTSKVSDDEPDAALVRQHFDLTPRGIIESLKLRQPDLSQDCLSRPLRPRSDFAWEQTDKAKVLARGP